jgi:hypothetical protein
MLTCVQSKCANQRDRTCTRTLAISTDTRDRADTVDSAAHITDPNWKGVGPLVVAVRKARAHTIPKPPEAQSRKADAGRTDDRTKTEHLF